MDVLLTDLNQNIKFTPAMKDWFNDFKSCNLNDLNIMFITENYYKSFSLYETEEFNNNFHIPRTSNVMFHTLNKTSNDNVPNSHAALWFNFNKELLQFISNVNTNNTVFIFIGQNTFTFSQYVDKKNNYVMFLPELGSCFWQDVECTDTVKENINFILGKHGNDKINW